ncbi:hypothetical protein QAD02_021289 [Eretmocerus hayati]|uniref:Uncharacterized protein n=1 Tax=Eretmocerus hayati TaxID=131215 RepID=A0ACC2PRP4_9HYME|nr:hypothetical protein QAD02_021289 [Eretmocerus hayati]
MVPRLPNDITPPNKSAAPEVSAASEASATPKMSAAPEGSDAPERSAAPVESAAPEVDELTSSSGEGDQLHASPGPSIPNENLSAVPRPQPRITSDILISPGKVGKPYKTFWQSPEFSGVIVRARVPSLGSDQAIDLFPFCLHDI